MNKSEKHDLLGTVRCTVPNFIGKDGKVLRQEVVVTGKSPWGKFSNKTYSVEDMNLNPVIMLKSNPSLSKHFYCSPEAKELLDASTEEELTVLLKFKKKDGTTKNDV